MRLGFVSYLIILLFALAAVAETPEAPKELQIESTYTPADCSNKAQNGDVLQVHYVSNGTSLFVTWMI